MEIFHGRMKMGWSPLYFSWTVSQNGLEKSILFVDRHLYIGERFDEPESAVVYARKLRPLTWNWLDFILTKNHPLSYKKIKWILDDFQLRFGFVGQKIYKGVDRLTEIKMIEIHKNIGHKIQEDAFRPR